MERRLESSDLGGTKRPMDRYRDGMHKDEGRSLLRELCILNGCEPNVLRWAIMEDFEENLKFIKENKLRTTHLKENIMIMADGLSEFGANWQFALNGYKKITVDQYYFLKYNIVLIYSNLPCIVVKRGNDHKNYYPIKILQVIDK